MTCSQKGLHWFLRESPEKIVIQWSEILVSAIYLDFTIAPHGKNEKGEWLRGSDFFFVCFWSVNWLTGVTWQDHRALERHQRESWDLHLSTSHCSTETAPFSSLSTVQPNLSALYLKAAWNGICSLFYFCNLT